MLTDLLLWGLGGGAVTFAGLWVRSGLKKLKDMPEPECQLIPLSDFKVGDVWRRNANLDLGLYMISLIHEGMQRVWFSPVGGSDHVSHGFPIADGNVKVPRDYTKIGSLSAHTPVVPTKNDEQPRTGNFKTKLKATDIPKVRAMLASGVQQHVVAEHFGVSQTAIGCIARGKTWRHVK